MKRLRVWAVLACVLAASPALGQTQVTGTFTTQRFSDWLGGLGASASLGASDSVPIRQNGVMKSWLPRNYFMERDGSNITAELATFRTNIGLGTSDTTRFDRLGLGGGTASDAYLRIGTLSTTPTATPDPIMVFGRAIVTVGEANAHGITDASSFNGSSSTGGAGSYNSYDARTLILGMGSAGASHYAAFQGRPIIDAGGVTIPQIKIYTTHGELNGATIVDKYYGMHMLEPDNNGSGIINQYFGTRYETINSSVATDAWAIYVVSNRTYFGGFNGYGINAPTSPIQFGGARADEVTVKDINSIYTRTTSGNAWLFTPLTNFPATGTQQFWAIRPSFAPSAVSSSDIYAANFSPTLGSGSANSNNVTGELTAVRLGWATDANYTGTVTKMFGLHVVDATAGGATITGQAGIAIDNLGTGTNRTLLLLGSTTVPSGIFSIYSPTSKNSHHAGQFFMGSSTGAMTIGGVSTQGLQIIGTTGYARSTIARFDAGAAGNAPSTFMGRSRGSTTVAGAVADGDRLFQLSALADDGSTAGQITVNSGSILAEVDGAVSTGIVPTRFAWQTMNTAGASAVRMQLTSGGLLAMGNGGASTPALKPSGSIMQVRLRDDSAYAALEALTLRTTGYTVATLPAAGTAGRRAYVTDQNAACVATGAALTGGGAVVCPVFDNGAAWVGG